jgi:hypothetical protein
MTAAKARLVAVDEGGRLDVTSPSSPLAQVKSYSLPGHLKDCSNHKLIPRYIPSKKANMASSNVKLRTEPTYLENGEIFQDLALT